MTKSCPDTSSATDASYGAPFGACPKDLYFHDLAACGASNILSLSETCRVTHYPELGIIAKVYHSSMDERIWDVMHRAGDSCVAAVGRVFARREQPDILGYIMSLETPLQASTIPDEDRRRIIYELQDLVTDIHSKNIIHGDIKPQNLLFCADGRLRLCDFDDASIEGRSFDSKARSIPYCCPARMRDSTTPLTRAGDIYSMGMTARTPAARTT
ncbi:kinase-like domain-containing protein [Mycena crocata]|nr:kinase-like domain-containing protein [Mycena crocata]